MRPIPPSSRSATGLIAPAVAGSIALSLTGAPPVAAATPEPAATTLPAERGPVPTARQATAAEGATHTVQAGETVTAIAARHGVRTADVLAWNGLGWRSLIRPGDVLRLTPAATPPAAPTATAPAPAAATHVVSHGQTLWAIARQHGVTVAELRAANALGSDLIRPGQRLTIPGAAPQSAPAAPTATATAAPVTHTVAAGDTLWSVAQRAGVPLRDLLAANGLREDAIIYPGQSLTLEAPPIAATPAAATAQRSATLDAEQAANARLIITMGRERGVSDRGIAIALATAMVESWMRNLDWGDRDSLGLFQQRPSMGWGTAEEVRDPARSVAAFYGGASDPNGATTRGLLDIPGWEALGFSEAAQAVQVSAHPDRYGQWEAAAYEWLRLHG